MYSLLLYRKVYMYIQLYIYTFFLNILFHYSLSQDDEYISLCYTIGPCCFSILYIYIYVYVSLHLSIPNSSPSLPQCPSPLATTSLFSLP